MLERQAQASSPSSVASSFTGAKSWSTVSSAAGPCCSIAAVACSFASRRAFTWSVSAVGSASASIARLGVAVHRDERAHDVLDLVGGR